MRITLDLDNIRNEVAKGKAVLLKIAFPKAIVRYRRSSSGKGSHVEVCDVDLTEKDVYNIRFIMGDHDKRIAIDVSRHLNDNVRLPQQVLFDFKIVKGEIKRAGEWIYV